MKKVINFIKSVGQEMKRVVWPTGRQWRKDVVVVLEMTLIFALFFGVSDWILERVITLVLK